MKCQADYAQTVVPVSTGFSSHVRNAQLLAANLSAAGPVGKVVHLSNGYIGGSLCQWTKQALSRVYSPYHWLKLCRDMYHGN
jgi:hypothetical protein